MRTALRSGRAPARFERTDAGPHHDDARLFRIVHALDALATELGETAPQNWLLRRSTVSSIILGARDEKQLLENVGSLGWSLGTHQVAPLDRASDVPAAYRVWQQRGFPMLNELS